MNSRFRAILRLALGLLFASGVLLRWTVTDRHPGAALIFYATPWPVLGAIGLLCALLSLPQKRAVILWVAGTAACIVFWIEGSWFDSSQSPAPQNFRLVSWNAEHPKHRLDEVISAARNFEADILGITETESTSPADAARWAKAFPDHSVQTLPGFMLFITRGKILSATTRSLNDRGRANVIELELQARRLRIVFVEFDANPFRSRAPAFAALEACMEVADGAELLVFGDFNTPLQSHFFAPLRQRWHHAFEQAGRGWSETWPVPSPALSLDHVWYSRGLTALRCEHGWSTLSDHRPVIADFAWPRQSESPLPPD